MANKRVAALGLDIGRKRIGVAGCDGLGMLATGLTTLEGCSFREIVAHLQTLVQARQVDQLVVGLPYNLNGELGRQGQHVQAFAQRLGRALALPVTYVDERLTSVQARETLVARGISPRRHKGAVDREAATIILQQWLDHRLDPPLDPPPPAPEALPEPLDQAGTQGHTGARVADGLGATLPPAPTPEQP